MSKQSVSQSVQCEFLLVKFFSSRPELVPFVDRRKVDWRLLPLLGTLSALSLIDRSNLGLARAAGMEKDLVCLHKLGKPNAGLTFFQSILPLVLDTVLSLAYFLFHTSCCKSSHFPPQISYLTLFFLMSPVNFQVTYSCASWASFIGLRSWLCLGAPFSWLWGSCLHGATWVSAASFSAPLRFVPP